MNDVMLEDILARTVVPEPEWEEESGVFPPSPEIRDRLTPYDGPMPEGSVPASNEWIET